MSPLSHIILLVFQAQVNCGDDQPVITSNRIKRQSGIHDKYKVAEPLVEVSNISFRVVMPSDVQAMKSFDRTASNVKGEIALFATVAVVCFLILVMFIVIKNRVYRPYFVWDKY